MSASSTRAQPDELRISPSTPGQLRPIGVLAIVLAAYPVGWATGLIPGWLATAGAAVFGAFIVFGLVTALRSHRYGWVVRLAPSGITVRGHDEIPWSDLREVAVTGLKPTWFYFIGQRRYPVVALLPRPGVTLPALRLPGGPGPQDRLGRARERLYGTRLVLMPHAMTASADEIAAVARDWGQLQVTWHGQRQP